MLYKVILIVSVYLFSCTRIDDIPHNLDITFNLKTLEYRKSYATMERELERLFATNSPQILCNLDISINKIITQDGLSSTTFAVNQNLNFITRYNLICDNGIKTSGAVVANNTMTLVQDRTMSQYVGQQYIDEVASKKTAEMIYNEIKMFLILNEKSSPKQAIISV